MTDLVPYDSRALTTRDQLGGRMPEGYPEPLEKSMVFGVCKASFPMKETKPSGDLRESHTPVVFSKT